MELFDTHFDEFGQILPVSGQKTLALSKCIKWWNYNRTLTIFRSLTQKSKQTSDYKCTHKMELFDTHFVWFDQVLAVSGQKTLAI